MKPNYIIILTILMFSINAFPQNIIPNGDFEDYSCLPIQFSETGCCDYWNNVNLSFSGATPDYFHILGAGSGQIPTTGLGYINAYSGDAIAGFYTCVGFVEYREYLSAPLVAPLIVGKSYKLSFYLSSGESNWGNGNSSDHIGIKFSKIPLNQSVSEVINLIPTLEIPYAVWTTTWQKFTFSFVADSAYSYITFGNFLPDNSTTMITNVVAAGNAYYYIDKVSLTSDDTTLYIYGNSKVCIGDSVTLYAMNDSIYSWANVLYPNTILSNDTSITVAITDTTTFIVYGSQDTAYFTVNAIHPPIVNLGNDTVLCPGQSFVITLPFSSASYLWQDNSNSHICNIDKEGVYWVEMKTGSCIARDTIIIEHLLDLDFGNDTTICSNDSITLDATTQNATYLWQDQSTNPIFTATNQGIYWVEISLNNCKIYDSIVLTTIDCEAICKMPNIITPNNDGYNDILTPIELKNIELLRTIIYNRWGNVVFDSSNPLIEWDGENCSDGVFFWIITYLDIFGNTNYINGTVSILRN